MIFPQFTEKDEYGFSKVDFLFIVDGLQSIIGESIIYNRLNYITGIYFVPIPVTLSL